jgi:hypothetical protein
LGGGPATSQSATDSLLATGLATGPGGRASGGTLSAQGSYQGDGLQFHLGRKTSANKGNAGDGSAQAFGDSADFRFNAQDPSNDSSGLTDPDDNTQALLFSAQQTGLSGANSGFTPGGHGFGGGGFGGPGAGTLGGAGFFPGLGGFGRAGGGDFAGGIGGGFVSRDLSAESTPNLSEISESSLKTISTPGNTTTTSTPGAGNRFGDQRFGGPHGYGRDLYNFTGTVKLNLDHFAADSGERPAITAVGIDPATQEIWAAVGKVLVHFDKGGRYLGEYYIVTPEGTWLRASAIVVEPDKLIVASDSRGVYEFARLDRRSAPKAAVQATVASPGTQQPDAVTPAQPH